MSGPDVTATHFPKPPPVVTRYAVPSQPPQYSNSPGSYGPSPPPYQHPGSAPPIQSYPPAQGSYPPPQYGGSAAPYSHYPSPQSYSAPPPSAQYGQGYQSPPQNRYPHNSAPQYNGSPAQSYAPSATQYQSPVGQFPSRSNSYTGPPPPKWNKLTPVSASSPFSASPQQQQIQQRQGSSSQREYSGTPIQQPQQNPLNESGQDSYAPQQTPQALSPGFNANEASQISQGSPVNDTCDLPKSATESIPSSRASTPYRRYGSVSSASDKQDAPSISVKSSPASLTGHVPEPVSLAEEAALMEAAKDAASKSSEEECGEEGEYTEEDLLQDEFNWDFKKIFKEPTPTEHVALSQPLSYTFTVTPVPLMDPRWAGSVSRYARKENLKEYLKPIRTQPQWDYLKEDPAFSDVKLEGPLIPLKELREWMIQRHGVAETTEAEDNSEVIDEIMTGEVRDEPENSRKRAWTDEQEDVDNDIQLEATVEKSIEQPSKRQRNETVEHDCTIVASPGTPIPGTPIIGRSGTPTFGEADDVWAPEPGEAASIPIDPTEALLASLGVSGAPKPVREESNLVAIEDQYATPPIGSIPHSMSPQAHASSNGTPHNNVVQNISQQGTQGSPPGPPQIHPGYGNPQYNNQQQGSSPNGNPYGPPQSNGPYSNHGVPVYNNNMPLQSNPNYAPPQQYSGPYNQPPPQRQPSFDNNQYGPPQGQYLPQVQYGPPQNQYPQQPPYNGPPNVQYGAPQPQWNTPLQGQYNGPPQYGPPQDQYGPPQGQYGGLPQGQYAQPHGQYPGPPQGQWGLPQNQFGPPQGQYNNGYPHNQGPPQYENPAYSPQDNPQYPDARHQGNQPHQQFNNEGPQPPRQDSGYASARGSYSNSSGPHASNGFTNGGSPQQKPPQTNGNKQIAKPPTEAVNAMPSAEHTSKKEAEKSEVNLESEDADIKEPESPLSPTSAEILGKLTQPAKPRKIIRVISGKNKNQTDDAAKKSKRAAPVVAEAYRFVNPLSYTLHRF